MMNDELICLTFSVIHLHACTCGVMIQICSDIGMKTTRIRPEKTKTEKLQIFDFFYSSSSAFLSQLVTKEDIKQEA